MVQYTKLTEKDILQISGKYNLEPVGFQRLERGAGNTSFRLQTTQNQYVLTVFEIENERVANLCKLLNLLEKHDFPTTRIEKMVNGSQITSFRGKSVILKPFIVGSVVRYLDENMLDQIGAIMARLHQIPSPNYLPGQHVYGLETFPCIIDQGINREYENWLAQKYDYISKTIPPGLPRGLIHGDVFFDNVLFVGNDFKAMIDFEEACHYYKIFDLGMAVVGLCTKSAKIQLPKIRALIEGYQGIRKLGQAEVAILKLFIEYAAVATSSWRFWKFNIDTPMIERSKKYMEMVSIAKEISAIRNKDFMRVVFP